MYVVLTLIFFSLVFWTFFEQASTSISNFTDRNVNRVFPERKITEADVGKLMKFRVETEPKDAALRELPLLSQEQLGHHYGDGGTVKADIARAVRIQGEEKIKQKGKIEAEKIEEMRKKNEKLAQAAIKDNLFTLTGLDNLREAAKDAKEDDNAPKTVDWRITAENVGMGVGGEEMPPSVFLSANPIYILIFGIILSALWTFLGRRGLEPATPIKFALGLMQVGLGFVALWYGAQHADARGMVPIFWLLARLPVAYHGRTLPVASRPLHDYQADSAVSGRHGHGHVVPGHGLFRVPVRHRCSIHQRWRRRRRRSRHPTATGYHSHLWRRLRQDRHRRDSRRGYPSCPLTTADAMDARTREAGTRNRGVASECRLRRNNIVLPQAAVARF